MGKIDMTSGKKLIALSIKMSVRWYISLIYLITVELKGKNKDEGNVYIDSMECEWSSTHPKLV